MSHNSRIAIAAASFLLFANATKSDAYGLSDLLHRYTGNPAQYQSLQNLDARRAQISSEINHAQLSGQLPPGEATNLMNQLNNVGAEEAGANYHNGIGMQQMNNMENQLNAIEANLSAISSNSHYYNNRHGFNDNNWLNNHEFSKHDLKAMYRNQGVYGSTMPYAVTTPEQLDDIRSNMHRLHELAREGKISPTQEQELTNALQQQMVAYHNTNPALGLYQTQPYGPNFNYNSYADPGFLSYLNRSNPSLLTQMRGYLGL